MSDCLIYGRLRQLTSDQPSPPEKKSFWAKSPNGTVSSNHRSILSDTEPFSIYRESLESYRRSFVSTSCGSIFLPHHSPSGFFFDRIYPRAPRCLQQTFFQPANPYKSTHALPHNYLAPLSMGPPFADPAPMAKPLDNQCHQPLNQKMHSKTSV